MAAAAAAAAASASHSPCCSSNALMAQSFLLIPSSLTQQHLPLLSSLQQQHQQQQQRGPRFNPRFPNGLFSLPISRSPPFIPSFTVLTAERDRCRSRQIVRSVKAFSDFKTTCKVTWQQFLFKPAILVTFIISAGFLCCNHAHAAESIKASGLGLRFASFLRRSGWPDEAIVLTMAMLPLLELRGAIPVGYWMQLDPLKLSILAVIGNMVPVPLIVLYLEKLATFLAEKSPGAKQFFDRFFEATRKKAGPIQEFEWLGLMLFVAVPFPGTGAWTGAMAASVLGMPFWDAMSANFLGVVIAGLLVNLLVNLGLKYALVVGAALFIASTFMWSLLRLVRNKS